MNATVRAVFDGEVLRLDEPLPLPPNTPVWVTIETTERAEPPRASFLQTARSLALEGPPDWSSRLDNYLYEGQAAVDD